jgi:hypothetical protein
MRHIPPIYIATIYKMRKTEAKIPLTVRDLDMHPKKCRMILN